MADGKRDRWKKYTLDGAAVDGPSLLWTQKDKARLPSSVDLRPDFGPVVDQEWLPTGSVACAVTAAAEFALRRQPHKGAWSQLSWLHAHWQAAYFSSQRPKAERGIRLTDGVMALMSAGATREADWPSRADRSDIMPGFGHSHTMIEFSTLDYADVWGGPDGVARTLAEGRPVLFVYAGPEKLLREAAMSGEMADPGKPVRGDAKSGHAMVVVGYEQSGDVLIVRNSFGSDWGDGGHVRMPLATFYSTAANLMAFGPMEANRTTKLVAGARDADARPGGADRRMGTEIYPGSNEQDAGHRKFIDALIGSESYPGEQERDAGHRKFIDALIGGAFADTAGDHNHRRFIDTLMSAGRAPLTQQPVSAAETSSPDGAGARLDGLRQNLRRELGDESDDASRDFRSRLRRQEDQIADRPPRGGRDDTGR